MAIITVDTLSDVIDANDQVTSLREAILQANANPDANTIVFDTLLGSGTIELTSELVLDTDITIDGDLNGDNIADITLNAASGERVFFLEGFDTDASLLSLAITGGEGFLYGGNIFAETVNSLTIQDSSILGGYSYYGGGIAIDQDNGQTFTLINSLVANNEADGLGGGIYIFGLGNTPGTSTIIGSTITGNYADTGGGVSSIFSNVSVHNSTIVGNEAFFRGGGLNIDEDDELVLTNSVVAENISTDGFSQNDIGGESDITSTNSFFGSDVIITTDNGGNINNGGDAGLGALGDQGGTVDTLLLEADSQLIGAGSVTALPADSLDLDGDGDTAEGFPIDGTGNSRVVDTLDIGASEFTLAANVVVSTLADEDDGDYSFGDLSLREALNVVRDGGTITFDDSLDGGTIGLTMGILSTSRDVTIDGDIDGDNAADIIISGTNNSGILELTEGTHVLTSLTFLNGFAQDAGALYVGFDAEVTGSHLSFLSNFAAANGGAVFNEGVLSLVNSTFSNNITNGDGGGIYNVGFLDVLQTTFYQNDAINSGGAILAGGFETVTNSTLVQNIAGFGGAIRDFGPSLVLTNSIVTGNVGIVDELDITGIVTQAGGNIIANTVYNGSTVTGATSFFEVFGDNDLSDNGGSVFTIGLASGSSAQGAGSLSLLPTDDFDLDGDENTAEFLPTDANGENRSDDGALDLGAVEYIGPEFTGDLSDGFEEVFFLETLQNDDVVFDVNANDGLGGSDESNISYILLGNVDGDGDGNLAFAFSAGGIVSVNDVDDLNFINSEGEFELTVVADNGAESNNTSAAFLDVTIIDLPETYTVTTLSDVVDANDGVLSLREALALAEQGPAQDTIIFDTSLSGGTITLGGSALDITRDIIILGDTDGDNVADVTIDAAGQSGVLTVAAQVELDGLNITGGNAEAGGGIFIEFGATATITNSSIYDNSSASGAGIFNGGVLNLFTSTIADNVSSGDGGGLRSEGFLLINTATFSGNSSGDDGGAIFSVNTTGFNVLDLTNVTFSGNSAVDDGGAIFTSDANVLLNNSTITGNISGDDGGGARFVNSFAQINNSIVSGNSAPGNDGNIRGNHDASNSLIDVNAANIFGSLDDNGGGLLADNGGLVETIALQAGGLAHSTGDASLLPTDAQDLDGDLNISEDLSLDANGNERVLGTLDIGAVEFFGPEFEGALADGTESFIFDETTAQNTVIIDVDANNGLGGTTDAGVSYSILSGNENGIFAIDSETGVVTLADAAAIDVELVGASDYTLVVQIDNGSSTNNVATATVSVVIDDVAETLVVTTLDDVVDENDGLLSLREAVLGANNGAAQETIVFDALLSGGTVVLDSALNLTQDIIIDGDVNGDNRADISISGDGGSTIFNLSGVNTDARVLSLTLTNATGAIAANDASSLFVMDTTIEFSSGLGAAGAITSVNTDAVVVNSLIRANSGELAGGIYSSGGDLSVLNTTLVFNNSSTGAGAVSVDSGNAEFINSTLIFNSGATAGGVDAADSVSFVNTAVTGNSGSGAPDVQADEIVATHSFFSTAVSITTDNGGNFNNGGFAGLTNLADRGATTETFGFMSTSPLIDAGSNAALPNDIYDIDEDGDTTEALPIDGRGERIQNGTVDIGASELSAVETLFGTHSDDTLLGSDNAETIFALSGNDVVNAGGGDDEITGGSGDDTIDGGAGVDTVVLGGSITNYDFSLSGGIITASDLVGNEGIDTLASIESFTFAEGTFEAILGTTGDDRLTGDDGDDLIFGGNGNDSLRGAIGADVINGDAGDDFISGRDGNDIIDGGEGNDDLFGGVDNDTLTGGSGDDTLIGGFGVDILDGGADNDTLNGGDANDMLFGGTGLDTLVGGAGNDTLSGDEDDDTLFGQSGNDTINGGLGDDLILGQFGDDIIEGGAGEDNIFAGAEDDIVFGGAGNDTIRGEGQADTLNGGGGEDTITGGTGRDTLFGDADNDSLFGQGGLDTIHGGTGDDDLFGGEANDVLFGDEGEDALFGENGNDTLSGGDGNDDLRGGAGNDILDGGVGTDVLRGQAGNDTFIFADGYQDDSIVNFVNDEDTLQISADFGFGTVEALLDTANGFVTQVDSNTVQFDFGNGDIFTINSGSDFTIADLVDDILIG